MTKKIATKIICPYCDRSITLDEAITHSIEEKMSKELQKKYNLKVKKTETELLKKDKQLKKLEKSVDEQVKEAIKLQKEEIEKEAKNKASKAVEIDLKDLKEQVKEKDELLQTAQKKELDLRKEKRKLDEAKKNFEQEIERKLDDERKKIYEEATKEIDEEHKLKDKEKDKQIQSLTDQIGDLKRKAEQGSQQLQGEVLELELEQVLKENFIHDQIESVSTGTRGADVLQVVCSNTGKICGTILLESKNTKNWSNSWISKLKKDQREAKADIGVIVTTVLPEGVNNFDYREGIVVVDYRCVVPVMVLLRNQISEIARTKNFNIGQNEKLEVLYKYLTGTEFRQKVETIVEAFANMMKDLQKEKRAMTKNWSKREKQIEQALFGVGGMYGDMQGLIGSSLPEIKSLDLLESDVDKDKED
tara:strand:- start:786 stop:2039 length:1254 start_codon:yes stop_codon:yes gene_type:complete